MNVQLPTTEITGPPNLYPGFVHFALRALVPGSEAPCAIRLESLLPNQPDPRLVVALPRGAEITPAWRQRLLQSGVTHVFAPLEELDLLLAYLSQQSQLALAGSTGDPMLGCQLAYEHALCCLKAALLDPRNGRRLGLGAATVRKLVDMIWDNQTTRQAMLKMLSRDQDLASHGLNTCLLAVGFARCLGWSRLTAERLGLAMFYHDLGLVDLDHPGPDDAIWDGIREGTAIEDHPRLARDYLLGIQDLDPGVPELVYSHHENLDGSGYPRGLAGEAIGPEARAARIVDIYETGTSGACGQPYSNPYALLLVMRNEIGLWLDRSLLEQFVRFLGQI
jgi:hypothetical protein